MAERSAPLGYKSSLDEDNIKAIKFYVTDVDRNHEKVEIPTYMSESEEHFLYILQEHSSLFQEKGLTHQIYPPDSLYGYFRKILKGVLGNTWDSIIDNGQMNQYNLEERNLEAFRVKIFCRNLNLKQVKCP